MKVELDILPINTCICYLDMSAVPRIGEKMVIFTDTTHLGCHATVTEVCWLIPLDEGAEDFSDCVVVDVQLDPNDDEYEFTCATLSKEGLVGDSGATVLKIDTEDKHEVEEV